MRRLYALLLFAALLMFISTPASADTLYTNGPVDGTTNAWTISGLTNIVDYAVTNSFSLASASTITGADFGSWLISGDILQSVDWAITTDPFGGTTLGSGTVTPAGSILFTNAYGFDILTQTFAIPNVLLAAGSYWLQLGNAISNYSDYYGVYWDQNSGPSSAFGLVTDLTASPPATTTFVPDGSESFDIQGTTNVPEPSTLLLLGSSLAVLGLFSVSFRR
jgi:hypothetical protein